MKPKTLILQGPMDIDEQVALARDIIDATELGTKQVWATTEKSACPVNEAGEVVHVFRYDETPTCQCGQAVNVLFCR